jgi:hypothetical protein
MLGSRIPTADTRIAPPAPKPVKTADPFYSSAAWIALRDAERAAAGGVCRTPGCGKPGHTVDHTVEIRDGGARLDPRNARLLCQSCHILKTNAARRARSDRESDVAAANHPDWLKPSLIPLLIVCGPPGAGKSTWAREQLGKGGLLIDLDEIMAELSSLPLYQAGREWLNPAIRRRNSLLGCLSRPARWARAALIVTEPAAERREWWATKLRPASVVVLETSEGVCIDRLNADPRREARRIEIAEAVHTWWSRYTRRVGDVIVPGGLKFFRVRRGDLASRGPQGEVFFSCLRFSAGKRIFLPNIGFFSFGRSGGDPMQAPSVSDAISDARESASNSGGAGIRRRAIGRRKM